MYRTPKHHIVYQNIMPNRFGKVNAGWKRAGDEICMRARPFSALPLL